MPLFSVCRSTYLDPCSPQHVHWSRQPSCDAPCLTTICTALNPAARFESSSHSPWLHPPVTGSFEAPPGPRNSHANPLGLSRSVCETLSSRHEHREFQVRIHSLMESAASWPLGANSSNPETLAQSRCCVRHFAGRVVAVWPSSLCAVEMRSNTAWLQRISLTCLLCVLPLFHEYHDESPSRCFSQQARCHVAAPDPSVPYMFGPDDPNKHPGSVLFFLQCHMTASNVRYLIW